eukprot:62958-Chlamydomonas_euryale.AAC.1
MRSSSDAASVSVMCRLRPLAIICETPGHAVARGGGGDGGGGGVAVMVVVVRLSMLSLGRESAGLDRMRWP